MIVKILFIGDIVGKPGRQLIKQYVPAMRRKYDAIIANGENCAGGQGFTAEIVRDLLGTGIDVLTGGNHTWQNKDVLTVIDKEDRLLRPHNYPVDPQVPGRGYGVYPLSGGAKIGVLNLQGRVFMKPMECPFRTGREALERIRKETPLILVDMHAEATSEKGAIARYFDGMATVVVGTHTHVQTADERILPGGTAFITDVGMTGPQDSIIGVRPDSVIHGFLTGMPVRHEVGSDDPRLCGVDIEADSETGRANSITRICISPTEETQG